MNKKIVQLDDYLNKNKTSGIELKRLEEDLQLVFDRLDKDEYKKGGFSKNKFNIPDRTKEYYVYLEFYCYLAKTWAKVLKEIGIDKYKTVVDLCPGYTPKIELALFYLNYSGRVLVLDKEMDSMKELVKFMNLFNPKYSITSKKIDVFKEKQKYEFIVANHIVDDLVIDHFCHKWSIKPGDVYEVEGMLKKIWEKILKDTDKNTSEILPKITNLFKNISKKGSTIVISQYQSYIERLLDINSVTKFNKNLLGKLIYELKKAGFLNERKLVKKALDKYKGHFKSNECFVLRRSR